MIWTYVLLKYTILTSFLCSNSFKIVLFLERGIPNIVSKSCWFQRMHPKHYSLTVLNCMLEGMTSAHRTQFFLSSRNLRLLHCIHTYTNSDDSYPNLNSLSPSHSLSLSLSLSNTVHLLCVFSFPYLLYSICPIIQRVTWMLETLRVTSNSKNFYQHTVIRVARDRTRVIIILKCFALLLPPSIFIYFLTLPSYARYEALVITVVAFPK